MASRKTRKNPVDGSVVVISLAGAAIVAAGVWYYIRMSKAQAGLPSGARSDGRDLPSSGPTDRSGRDSTDGPSVGGQPQGGQPQGGQPQGGQPQGGQPQGGQPQSFQPEQPQSFQPEQPQGGKPQSFQPEQQPEQPRGGGRAPQTAGTNASTREAANWLDRLNYPQSANFESRVRSFQQQYNRENVERSSGRRPGPVIQPPRLTVDGRVGQSTLTAMRNYIARLNRGAATGGGRGGGGGGGNRGAAQPEKSFLDRVTDYFE